MSEKLNRKYILLDKKSWAPFNEAISELVEPGTQHIIVGLPDEWVYLGVSEGRQEYEFIHNFGVVNDKDTGIDIVHVVKERNPKKILLYNPGVIVFNKVPRVWVLPFAGNTKDDFIRITTKYDELLNQGLVKRPSFKKG